MKPLSQLVRPNILALQPYSTARDEYAGGGIGVWLDANESPYDNGVNRYPDPHQRELKAQLAALKGVRSGQIFLGNGSDEAIDLAFRIFCEPGRDNAVSIAPTYGMYRVAAQTNGVELREVPLGADFSLPVEALLAAADGRTKLLWLCSPNNPTGKWACYLMLVYYWLRLRIAAIPLGLIAGTILGYISVKFTGHFISDINDAAKEIIMRPFTFSLPFHISVWTYLFAGVFSFCIVLFSAYRPAKKVGKFTAIQCVKGIGAGTALKESR